ncbi:RHS repeat-associated core domain-containing protein [Hafnia alvei]|uniref:RHS repeat-associated core domain-containing protein n=1 Tax=Hafnia alvei TaxID=569 RepID=UPI001035474F|nr:RHS repeat-associated core domain-containing protein [Hafnia alvei]TBL82570.1 hypothetical protein EYY88_21025 [Hafnia alvei]
MANFRYNPQQRLSEYHQGNGLVNRYGYSPRGQRNLHKIYRSEQPNVALWEQRYRYASQGNLQETAGNEARHYQYDSLSRLSAVDAPNGEPDAYNSETFRWDAAGNPVYGAFRTDAQNVAPGNRLAHYSGKRFEYDRFGNLISESVENHAGLLLIKRFHYDCQHRLVKAEMPDGTSAHYTYDAFNRRLSKTVNNVTTLFIWRGHRLAAQMEGDRENYYNYIYRPNSFEPLAMTRHHSFEYDYYQEHRSTDRTLPVKQKPEIYWYQNDHLGTPHCLTDAHGQAVWKSSYLAFGSIKTEANNGAGIDNPLRFSGQYHDRETGLFYNLNRYYDPTMKRYLTQDPLKLAAGLNFYLYVSANPITLMDPLGLMGMPNSGISSTGDRSPEPNIVYRALTKEDADRVAAGLSIEAKAPDGSWSAAEHVSNHSDDPSLPGGASVNSPWISTTKLEDVANAYDSGYGVVVIDLNKVPSTPVEVWQTATRATGIDGLAYHRSIWAQEVTIHLSIPNTAIIGK